MQAQTLPGMQSTLSFEDIAPRQTSSRRVAAAAFYHCLGKPLSFMLLLVNRLSCGLNLALATKDLMTVKQELSYGDLSVRIK